MASHLSLRRMFNYLNRKYFNNEVPATTSVMWAPLDTANADYSDGVIRVDVRITHSPKLVETVMLHEMIHAHNPRLTHGKKFQAEVDRLYSLGAYRKLL